MLAIAIVLGATSSCMQVAKTALDIMSAIQDGQLALEKVERLSEMYFKNQRDLCAAKVFTCTEARYQELDKQEKLVLLKLDACSTALRSAVKVAQGTHQLTKQESKDAFYNFLTAYKDLQGALVQLGVMGPSFSTEAGVQTDLLGERIYKNE